MKRSIIASILGTLAMLILNWIYPWKLMSPVLAYLMILIMVPFISHLVFKIWK